MNCFDAFAFSTHFRWIGHLVEMNWQRRLKHVMRLENGFLWNFTESLKSTSFERTFLSSHHFWACVCVHSRSWFSSKILSRIYKLETYQMDLSFRRGYVTCAQMCTFCEGKFSHARHARIQFNDNRLRKWGPHAVSSFIFLHSLLKSKVLRKHTKLTLFAALHLCQSIVVDVV